MLFVSSCLVLPYLLSESPFTVPCHQQVQCTSFPMTPGGLIRLPASTPLSDPISSRHSFSPLYAPYCACTASPRSLQPTRGLHIGPQLLSSKTSVSRAMSSSSQRLQLVKPSAFSVCLRAVTYRRMLLTKYLAYLTFWSLGFYFLISSTHTFVYAFRRSTWLRKWPRSLQLAHSVYYSSITSFPFLVTIIFWGTMNSGWPTGRFEQWVIISVHGLNSVFAITEIVLPATAPLPFTHLLVLLGVLSAYLGLAYLTRYTQNWYVYEWLNPAHGNASIVLHVLGYAGAMVAIFFVVHYAIVARNMLATRLEARRSKGRRKRTTSLDTWSA
jgi:hypothetical protein